MDVVAAAEITKKVLEAKKIGETALDASDGKLDFSKAIDFSTKMPEVGSKFSDHINLWNESKIGINDDLDNSYEIGAKKEFPREKGENISESNPITNRMDKISYDIHTRNESLEGDRHPITGVPFERKTVLDSEGNEVTGVFPVFDSKFDVQLPEDLENATDGEQFAECNKQLKEAIEKNPELAKQFTPEQLEQIQNGDTPDGYTWHHNEEKGKLQLVDAEIHAKTGHTGGRNIWGGGSENR